MNYLHKYFVLFILGLFSVTAQHSIRGEIADNLGNSIPFANGILQEKGSEINF